VRERATTEQLGLGVRADLPGGEAVHDGSHPAAEQRDAAEANLASARAALAAAKLARLTHSVNMTAP